MWDFLIFDVEFFFTFKKMSMSKEEGILALQRMGFFRTKLDLTQSIKYDIENNPYNPLFSQKEWNNRLYNDPSLVTELDLKLNRYDYLVKKEPMKLTKKDHVQMRLLKKLRAKSHYDIESALKNLKLKM